MKTPSNNAAFESAPDKAISIPPISNQPALNTNSPRSITMLDQTIPNQLTASTSTDLKSLRLPHNYGETLGVKKLLTNVLVGKPKKAQFFRTHISEDMTFPAMILEIKEARESYVVVHEVAQGISELVRPVMLHAAIDRQNNVSLIPIPLPGEDGNRHQTHESLAQAVEHSKLKWVRITYNQHTSGYDVYEAEGDLPEPEWPVYDIGALIQVAFRGKIITKLDHPIVQSLLGKV